MGLLSLDLTNSLHETQKEHQKLSQNQLANGTGCEVQVDVD
jgi:hypothetical protein